MGILEIQFFATLENLQDLTLPLSEDWHFVVKCTHCNEQHPNTIYFNLQEIKDIENARGKANYYSKCSYCKREGTILFLESSFQTYNSSEKYQTVAKFECRGLEILEFVPNGHFHAQSTASEETFDDIVLTDKDWAGYDETGDASVGIYDFKSQIITSKK
ncbi:UNKNOWN [Stylonychia lemnae]|uniref:Uncharacterized protein n=1 Tax=Stylonychia lemnae TaxID=5949 RepID=A0A077ZMD3_STYLE|nr:UNKNOWN [Stylonychia lemnae]|eukprot:CDW71123.1 UNKNOWN [Stylonychia lemnae]